MGPVSTKVQVEEYQQTTTAKETTRQEALYAIPTTAARQQGNCLDIPESESGLCNKPTSTISTVTLCYVEWLISNECCHLQHIFEIYITIYR